MNKKIIAVMLTMIMIVGNCMTVLADTTWDGNSYTGGNSKDVTGKLIKINDGSTAYSVTITWDALQYEYVGKVKWDSGNNYYTVDDSTKTEAGWTATGGNSITVQNASEGKVIATLSYGANSSVVNGVDGTLSSTNKVLDSKAVNVAATEDDMKLVSTLAISGVPNWIKVASLTNVVLGTVTVSLEATN